ncbi:unnamed protein product [Cladocopium goreaui]|uniref:Uncharacterized protein n=1 Tax=Cladocopium goreaui TaxID=2562237 RepID=A0A9P1FPW3_9DINO|nr:unnamed protein product [Cladocopium goreaui]
MAKQEALHTPAISDNFDVAADTDCLWIAASVQTTDELLPQITSARTCHDGDIVVLVLNPTAGMKRRLKSTYCRATCTQRAVVPDLGKAWQSNRNATAKQSSL